MKTYVEQLIKRRDWKNQPYFAALRDGAMTRDDFVETQIKRQWLTSERIIHYATHEELDEEHAEGFCATFADLTAPLTAGGWVNS